MAEKTEDANTEKKGKKGLLIPAVVLAVGMLGGGYFFMSSGKNANAAPAASTTSTTKLGKIVRLSPITLNLSDGHVLKVGLALQMVEKPKEAELAAILAGGGGGHGSSASSDTSASPLEGQEAKALDLAINDLGNLTFEELSKPGGRAAAKKEIEEKIEHIYEGDVVGVYFTDFVMS